jgi:peptide/nickel transport system substrate-binding protein
MALAIDEDAIVSRVMRGQGRATWELWGPGVNGYNAALDVRPKVDIAKAKALLAEAGYPNGFEVTLDCSNDRYIADEQICVALSSMYAKIGVKVNVFARTKVKFFSDIAYPDYKTSFYMLGWTPSTYDADNVIRDHIASRSMKLSVGNATGYSNPKVDQLEAQISQELDAKKRQAMIDEVIKIVQSDLPLIPLHQQGITWAARTNIDLTQPADNSIPMRWVRKH